MKILNKIDFNIKQKLFINPIMTILVLAILFIIVFIGIIIQEKGIKDIYENRFKNFSDSAEISDNILIIHSNLNQLLIWASSDKEKFRVKEESKKILENIEILVNNVNEKLKIICSIKDKEICDLLTNQLNDYKEWAIKITESVDNNLNNTNTYMLIINETLKEIQKSLHLLKEEKLKSSKISYDNLTKNCFYIKISISVLFFLLAVLSIVISFILIKSILNPINHLKTVLEDIAHGDGDLTKKIDIKKNDEIGELGIIINTFINKIKDIVIHIKETSTNGKGMSSTLADISKNVSNKINEISSSIKSDKNNINLLNNNLQNSVSAVSQITDSIKNITNSINSQFDSVHKSSVSTEEMAAIINNLSKIINEKKNLSINLSGLAKTGLEKMNESTEAINKISKSSSDILEMMKIIDEIARETNLLAMNAAIEAAHAGEFGKGFSVVSDEIRKLSEETTNNSKSINGMLKQIIFDINNYSELYKITHESLYNIINGIQEVINAMEEMYSSANELVIGSNEIVNVTSELTNISQNIKSNVSEINKSSDSINDNLINNSQLSSIILKEIDNIDTMSINISSTINDLTVVGESNKKNILEIDKNLNQFKTE